MRTQKNRLLTMAMLWVASGLVSTAMAQSPATETQTYLNDGVGLDARQAMQAQRKQYNLRLAFAQAHSGEYLAGVDLSIQRQGDKATAMRYEDCGPLFYAKLPPGRYRVLADYKGKKRELLTTVGAKGVDQVMYWP